jgi:hypothetical protein
MLIPNAESNEKGKNHLLGKKKIHGKNKYFLGKNQSLLLGKNKYLLGNEKEVKIFQIAIKILVFLEKNEK